MPKILIADDEANIRQLLRQTLEELEDEGVEILLAENGRQALQVIQDERPDLVFLDVMMPFMNGYDVCKTVKKTDPVPGVTVIILTAKGQEIDRISSRVVGADYYISKPFSPSYILLKAREILKLPG
jgi:DNA-binding response OmpR family regulator